MRERLRLFRSIRQLNRLHCFFASQDDVLDEFRSIETSRLKLSDSTTTINKAFTGREAGGRKVARSSYPETCAFVEFHLVSRSQGSIKSLWALQGLASKFKFYSLFPSTIHFSVQLDRKRLRLLHLAKLSVTFFQYLHPRHQQVRLPFDVTSTFLYSSPGSLPPYLPPSTTSRINPSRSRFFARSLKFRGLFGQSQDHS